MLLRRFALFLVAWPALMLLSGCKDASSVADETDIEPPASSAPDALKKRIDDAIAYTAGQRLMNVRDQAAWQIVHGLEAFGRQLNIEVDGKPVCASIICSREIRSRAGRFGRAKNCPTAALAFSCCSRPGSKTGEGHPDQWLGYLSQCGDVKLDDEVVVGGKTYHVRDMLAQAQWDIYDGMEASWTLMAAATYLPLDATWTSKTGKDEKDRQWSIERVVRMEAAQPLGVGGCYGSHRLYALAPCA